MKSTIEIHKTLSRFISGEHYIYYNVKANEKFEMTPVVEFVYGGYSGVEDYIDIRMNYDKLLEEQQPPDWVKADIADAMYRRVGKDIEEIKVVEDAMEKQKFEVISVSEEIRMLLVNIKFDGQEEILHVKLFGEDKWSLHIPFKTERTIVNYYQAYSRWRRDLYEALINDDKLKMLLLFKPDYYFDHF